jgi:hypothetical protein
VLVSVSIQTDQLLGRQIRQHQGTGDNPASERIARQEIAFAMRVVVVAGFKIGYDRDHRRERNKREEGEHRESIEVSFARPHIASQTAASQEINRPPDNFNPINHPTREEAPSP